jgi:vitamin K-dependent gamma-carboxylase
MQTVSTEEVQITAVPAGSTKAGLLRETCAALFRPVDISFLVFFRVLFGSILVWEVYRYFAHGWISRYFINPAVNFTYYGFSWVKPWPGRGMYIHFCARSGSSVRDAGVCLPHRHANPFSCLHVLLSAGPNALHESFYLVCLISFLMCFFRLNGAFQFDALLRPKIRSDVVPAWTWWLLRAQIGIPYLYGGIAKLNSDWIRGGEPMRIWLRPLTRVTSVDLTKEEVSLLPTPWIMPLTTPLGTGGASGAVED